MHASQHISQDAMLCYLYRQQLFEIVCRQDD
jgi:hypothetical protein